MRIGMDNINLQCSPLGICGSGTLRASAESTKMRSWTSMLYRNVGLFVNGVVVDDAELSPTVQYCRDIATRKVQRLETVRIGGRDITSSIVPFAANEIVKPPVGLTCAQAGNEGNTNRPRRLDVGSQRVNDSYRVRPARDSIVSDCNLTRRYIRSLQ